METIILTLHILGAGFLLAVLTFAILFLIKKPFTKERISNIRAVINVGAWAFIWQIISGALLFAQKPEDFKSSISFWIKIGLFILDLIVGLMLVNRKLKAIEKDQSSKVISVSSLITWTIFNLVVAVVIIVLSIFIAK